SRSAASWVAAERPADTSGSIALAGGRSSRIVPTPSFTSSRTESLTSALARQVSSSRRPSFQTGRRTALDRSTQSVGERCSRDAELRGRVGSVGAAPSPEELQGGRRRRPFQERRERGG